MVHAATSDIMQLMRVRHCGGSLRCQGVKKCNRVQAQDAGRQRSSRPYLKLGSVVEEMPCASTHRTKQRRQLHSTRPVTDRLSDTFFVLPVCEVRGMVDACGGV